jgi:hypothetical protein
VIGTVRSAIDQPTALPEHTTWFSLTRT